MALDDVVSWLCAQRPPDRPLIVAVDGRSGAGKSTLAGWLLDATPGATIVHTDDLAWHEPYFEWGQLLREGVLRPLHASEPVEFRPPAWIARGRDGAVTVPRGSAVVFIEGVGAAQRAAFDLVDVAVWVQSDSAQAERRGIERDVADGSNGDRDQSVAYWHEWMSYENPFLADDRPWDRAHLFIAGTPTVPLAPGQVAVRFP